MFDFVTFLSSLFNINGTPDKSSRTNEAFNPPRLSSHLEFYVESFSFHIEIRKIIVYFMNESS